MPSDTIGIHGTMSRALGDYFTDPDGDELTYSVTSSDVSIAAIELNGENVNLTGTGIGVAAIKYEARDPDGLTAILESTVTVVSVPTYIVGRINVRTGVYDLFEHLRLSTADRRRDNPNSHCDVRGGDTVPCWRVPVVAGRDTVYTDSLGAFALEVADPSGPVRLYVDELNMPRKVPRFIPPHAGVLDHVRFDTVTVEPVQYDTTRADMTGESIPIVMVSVGVDDGTFAGAPLEGVTVTLLATDTTTLAQRVTGDLGLVRFRGDDLPPPGDHFYVTLDGGYDAGRYRCREGIGNLMESPASGWSFSGFVCVDRHGQAAKVSARRDSHVSRLTRRFKSPEGAILRRSSGPDLP